MSRPDARFALAVLALVAVLGWVNITTHEMGRDELHSWGVALTSHSVSELRANYDYDRHPRLWFFSLWALSCVAQSPFAMIALSLAFSLAGAWIVLAYAPFPRLVRVLYVLGYLHLYEYGTLSRGYTQGEFFALWICAAYPLAAVRPLLIAVPVFLLAQTSLYGAFLAGAFGVVLAVDLFADRDASPRARALIGTAVALGLAVALWSLLPKPDSDEEGYAWCFHFDGARLLDALCVIGQALVPVPDPTFHYWCSNFLDAYLPLQLGVSVFLAFASACVLASSRRGALFFGVMALAIVGFAYVKTAGQIRHHGHLFLALFFACWLARAGEKTVAWSDGRARLLGGLLALHAVAGLGASIADWVWPFSQSAAVASWLREHHLEDAELIGEPDAIVAPIGVLLGRPLYFLDTNRTALFVVFRDRKHLFDPAALAAKLRGPRPVYWITNRPFVPGDPATGTSVVAGVPLAYERVMATGDAIRWDERYWVYRVTPR